MLEHLLPWQKVPSPQGVSLLAQGALTPPHSFALQEDISVLGSVEDMKPSEQNPPIHFCPIGQLPPERQGSLAEPPVHLPKLLLDARVGINNFTSTKATKATDKIRPIPDVSLKDIPSDVASENA
jgi:hypothetical protein